jgi:hypothetical protein
VSDTEIPADLIALKLKFYEAERKQAELARAEPFDAERWQATRERLADLAVQIHRHPALQALPPVERLKLDTAASRAAREQLAGQDPAGG